MFLRHPRCVRSAAIDFVSGVCICMFEESVVCFRRDVFVFFCFFFSFLFCFFFFFFLMIRRPPRSTLDRSSAASDVYKRQVFDRVREYLRDNRNKKEGIPSIINNALNSTLSRTAVTGLSTMFVLIVLFLSLIHISEPTRPY